MQDVFTKGMNRWFALKEFQVGVPTDDIDIRDRALRSFNQRLTRLVRFPQLSGEH